jgi:N-acetylglucosamine kinase-like BadF-type ATPase
MTKPFVLGVDGGGSKTADVIVDERAQPLGRWFAGAANYHLVGEEEAQAAVREAMFKAAAAASVDLANAAAAVWALAGAGSEADRQLLAGLCADLLPGVPGAVVTDAEAALAGGVAGGAGIVLIAGSGMMVYGVNGAGESARAGGWGHLLDTGGGYALALAGLKAATRALDGAAPPTRLQRLLLDALPLDDLVNLPQWLYAPNRRGAEIAALAPRVLAAAAARDETAIEIADAGALALATSAGAVARRLRLDATPSFPLTWTGGLLTFSAFYRALTLRAIAERVPAARPQPPKHDAAVGAGLLAWAHLHTQR